MSPKNTLLLAAVLAGASLATAQDASAPPRPHLLGIAHVSFYVHDMALSRQWYTGFLGFAEPFSLKNSDGSLRLTWIKINDHQFIELFPEKAPGTDRLVQVSLQTDDADAMRLYLKSRGIAVPDKTGTGKSGTLQFTTKDPDGHTIEFVQYPPDCWIAKDYGKDLPDTRISKRIPHCGIMVHDLDASLKFYEGVLGCTETWRGSKNEKVLSWVNVKLPDSRDYLELMLYGTMPALARINTLHHVCLEVDSVYKTQDILKTRPNDTHGMSKVAVGVNGKRQINYYDPDGTRIEVMEPTTADGKVVPPSTAPPPGAM